MIHYIKGDLFKAPATQLKVHACNCQGVWGSGVAVQFKDKYPLEYFLYNMFCLKYENLLQGKALILNNIGCLFTSKNYGNKVDSPEQIVYNTEKAIRDLISKTTMDIAMPKINSGLFKVPWEQTEAVLKQFPHVNFYVYTGE
jgi:ADP-ribose 1''-phosphate phosphatase